MKTHWMKTALLAALCAAAAGCRPRTEAAETRTVRVETILVTEAETEHSHEYIGVVEEESASVLSFAVPGTVKQVAVHEGEHVCKGQLLAQLTDENRQSAHTAAQATLRQAEDAMRRLQLLHDNGSLPEIQYVEAQTKLAQARSMAEVAAKNLDDSSLRAPFDGIIGRRSADAGENVMAGQPVLTLLDNQTVKVKCSIPENEIASISTGSKAQVRIKALGDLPFNGAVVEKGVIGNPLSHTYEVKVRLSNNNGAMMPGMVCNVTMQGDETPGAIVLPARAVQVSHTGRHSVWTVAEGRALQTEVTTGPLTGEGILIRSGLRNGDHVIVGGAHKVGNGTQVIEL